MSDSVAFRVQVDNNASGPIRQISSELDGMRSSAEGAGNTGRSALSGIMDVAGGILAAGVIQNIGAQFVSTAADILSFGGEVAQGQRDLQAQFGLTEDRAATLGNIGKEVFGNNFADSASEAMSVVARLDQQLAGIPDSSLKPVTEGVFAISDAFGTETSQNIDAAKALMTNFGLSGQEALDFITTGMQQGLNANGDFLDSIGEYSTQFATGGADAGQFFSVLETGMSTGVLATDKAGDLFKEFVVRIQDGSTLTAESLSMLGINADQMLSSLADGTMEPIEAFQIVQERLRGVGDEAVQSQAGVGLLGTQFEDLGPAAVLAIDTANTVMNDMAGATDSLNVQYENFGAVWSTVWRQTLLSLEPISTALLNLAGTAMPMVMAGFESAQPSIQAFAHGITGAIGFVQQMTTSFQTNFTTSSDVTSSSFGAIRETISSVIESVWSVINSVLSQIASFWRRNNADILATTKSLWQQIGSSIRLALELIDSTVGHVLRGVASFINSHGDEISSTFRSYWDVITSSIQTSLDLLTGMLRVFIAAANGDWDAFGRELENTARTLWGNLENQFSASLDYLQNITSLAWSALNEITNGKAQEILNTVTTAWQNITTTTNTAWNGLVSIITPIASLIGAIMDVPVALIQKAFELLAAVFTGPVAAAFNNLYSGIIQPVATQIGAVFGPPLAIAEGVWNSFTSMLQGAVSGALSTVTGRIDGVVSSLGFIGGAISGAIGHFQRLADSIRNIEIPSWLQGQSPPPLAHWIDFISDAVNLMHVAFDDLGGHLDANTSASIEDFAMGPMTELRNSLTRAEAAGMDVTGALPDMEGAVGMAQKAVDFLTIALDQAGGQMSDRVLGQVREFIDTGISPLTGSLEKNKASFDNVRLTLPALEDWIHHVEGATNQLTFTNEYFAETLDEDIQDAINTTISTGLVPLRDMLDRAKEGTEGATVVLPDYQFALDTVTNASDLLTTALQTTNTTMSADTVRAIERTINTGLNPIQDVLNRVIGVTDETTGAAERLADTQTSITTWAMASGGRTLDLSSTFRQFQDVLGEGVNPEIMAMTDTLPIINDEFNALRDVMGYTDDSATRLTQTLNDIPRSITIDVNTNVGGYSVSTPGGGDAAPLPVDIQPSGEDFGPSLPVVKPGPIRRPFADAGAQTGVVTRGNEVASVTNNYYLTANYRNPETESGILQTLNRLRLLTN